jgi:hypothetical protein
MASQDAACPIFEGSQRLAGVRSDPNYMEIAARLISILKFRKKALGPEGFLSEHKVDDALRFLVLSPSAAPLVNETFAAISATHQVAEKQALGELRDVHAAGYANFFGMAGLHRFFHTPADDPRTTSPEILEPVGSGLRRCGPKNRGTRPTRIQVARGLRLAAAGGTMY